MNIRGDDLEKRFTDVYRRNLWGPQKSGPGSTLEGTRRMREEIAALLRDLFPPASCLTFVDAGCGDMAWMPHLLEDLTVGRGYSLRHIGVDIVRGLIEKNSKTFHDTAQIQYHFMQRDLTKIPPPRGDIIFCKDLVNHLVFDHIWNLLEGFNKSETPWLLITSNEGYRNLSVENMDGNASRHLNLEAAPFCLPAPEWSNGYLALWKLPLPLHKEKDGGETP